MIRLKTYIALVLLFIMLGCTINVKDEKEYFVVPGNPSFNEFNEMINFNSISAANLEEAVDTIIAYSKEEFKKIYNIPDADRTFKNTMLIGDDISNDIGKLARINYLISHTHPDSTIRNTALQLNNKLQKYGNEISLDENLYKAVKAYSKTEDAQQLTGHRKKMLKESIEEFERNGFALALEDRDELKIIKDAISEIGNDFNKNIASYSDFLIVNDSEIAGLPEDYKKSRKLDDGSYKIDLSYPSYRPFMKYSHSDDARRKLFMKYYNRASDKNMEVLQKLLIERDNMAKLLEYRSYAEWRLDDRMAKRPKTVWDFENDLSSSINTKSESDYKELLETKNNSGIQTANGEINPWERSYIENILLEQKYQLDAEEVKQYFPLDNVLDGLFQITQTIFSVTYREQENPSVWHPDVRAFEVLDGEKVIGRFYLDLFPRENKYKHAACFGLIPGKMTDMGYQIPTASLVCNFPSPTDEIPSLMPHSQVETLFHEFGHVLHHMLTETELSAHSGTSVARDFVEAPSQIFENWAWNYESLKLFARHWETGEILPKDLFGKMLAAKNVGSGLATEGQVFLGTLDMTLHDNYNPNSDETTDDVVKELRDEITHFPHVEGTHFQTAFGHLNGYGASYYGYLWSQVYAEDMFSVFDQNGILDKDTGMKYRKIILAKGGSKDPMDLVKEFLGREPNNKAFMKSLGL